MKKLPISVENFAIENMGGLSLRHWICGAGMKITGAKPKIYYSLRAAQKAMHKIIRNWNNKISRR